MAQSPKSGDQHPDPAVETSSPASAPLPSPEATAAPAAPETEPAAAPIDGQPSSAEPEPAPVSVPESAPAPDTGALDTAALDAGPPPEPASPHETGPGPEDAAPPEGGSVGEAEPAPRSFTTRPAATEELLDDETAPLPASFAEMGVKDQVLLDALAELKWTRPTRVQVRSFEPVSQGTDVLVQSQTGTGKTGAFCIPWLAGRFQPGETEKKGVQLLVLVPTRELAKQVCDQLVSLAKASALRPLPVYGGTAIGPQIDALRAGVDAVVGTPGRILDHIRRRTLKLSTVNMVVLDEADEMLSMGFLEDIHAILDACPSERQTCLFSATVPPDIERIARRYMRRPVPIRLSGDQVAASQIQHAYYTVSGTLRTRDLLDVIALEEPATALTFCNTREETNLVANVLRREGYQAEALSSDLSQAAREHVLGQMRAGRLRFLVATDVASRGIDISHISHVINYTFPENAESYIHRTGRTGRAGRAGQAISLIAPHELGNFYYLKLQYPTLKFDSRDLPPAADLEAQRIENKLDLISKRFPELVSPEWTLLARNLMKDPRGEQVVAFLLSQAMTRTETVSSSAEPVSEAEPRELEEGRFRRRRDHDRDRDRDRDRGRDRGRRRSRGDDRWGDERATPGREAQAPASEILDAEPPEELEPPRTLAEEDGREADPSDGRRRKRRRRRRRGDDERDETGSVEAAADGSRSDEDETGDDAFEGPAEPAPLAELATASLEPTGPQAVVSHDEPEAAPVEAEAELVASIAPTALADAPDSGVSLDEGGRKRRRRRRRRRKGGADEGAAQAGADEGASSDDEDPTEVAVKGDAAESEDDRGSKKRRRRRGRNNRPAAPPADVAPHPSQDQIIIDIDETELEVVRGEFGEIDELDDLTLKGRRRGVIDALQEEVELEDLADEAARASEGAAVAKPEEEATVADDEGSEDAAEEALEAGDEDDDDKKKKRRRRRRKKKKAEVVTPELTAPPHKDFWEVWAAKFSYRDFEDAVSAEVADEPDDDEDEVPASATFERTRVAATIEEPRDDEEFVRVSLSIGRAHGKKSAHIRELLANEFGLAGKSIRDLTVGDELTHFRVGRSSYERLERGMLGYVFDDVELVLSLVEDRAEAEAPAHEEPPAEPLTT